MPQDSLGLSPGQLAQAFRSAFPRYRADIQTDAELYQHLVETQPQGMQQLTGLQPKQPLEGAYLPAPGDTARAYRTTMTPLPTVPPKGNLLTTAATTAIRVAPPLATGVATAVGALPSFGASVPAGLAASGGAAAAGESLAQEVERRLGLREEIEPKLIGTAAGFGMIPGARLPTALGTVARAGVRAAEGTGLALAQQETESRLLGTERPTGAERLTAGAVGAVFGGGFGAIESKVLRRTFEEAAEQVRQRTMTRAGLAQTIQRIAGDVEMDGVPAAQARQYAARAARALYQGRDVPPPPKAEFPTEYQEIGRRNHAVRSHYENSGWQLDPRWGSSEDFVRYMRRTGPEPVEHGPYPREIEAIADLLPAAMQVAPRAPRLVRPPEAQGYTVPPRAGAPEGPGLPPPPGPTEGPLPEPNPAVTPGEQRFGAAFDAALGRPAPEAPRLLPPDAGQVTARPARVPPGAEVRAQVQALSQRGTQKALKSVPGFARALEPPPRPSVTQQRAFERGSRRGVRAATQGAPQRMTRLDEPPRVAEDLLPPPPREATAAERGAAAMREYQTPGGSLQRAQEGARTTMAPPPPPFKDVVLVDEGGLPIGNVRVPGDYGMSMIGEAEYNSLYAPKEAAPAPPSPLDPRGEAGAVRLPQRPPIDFAVAPGDGPALQNWMRANRQHVGEGFYQRAEAALAAKNPTRAWQVIQAEAMQSRGPAAANKARIFAKIRGEQGMVRQQEGGVRRRDYIPQPPAVKKTQRGGLITMRASGLKDVGDLPEPTTIAALPPQIQQRVLKAIDRARLGRIKGNQDTDYRLFRQVAQQVLEGEPRMRAVSRALGLTPEELARGWTDQVSEAGRVLQRLSQLSREIPNVVDEVSAKAGTASPRGLQRALADLADADSADESLQKLYGGLFGLDPTEALEWARRSAQAMNEVHAQHLLERASPRGPLQAFNDLRKAGLTGTIAAFWRNAAVGGLRWNAGIMSDAIGAILSADPTVRRELAGRAKDRITAAPHLWNTLAKPWASSIFEMWPSIARVALAGRDPRKTLKAIASFDDAEAHFLGLAQQDLPQSTGQRQYITLIQSANRAQEYPLRALAADLRLRQLVRRRGFDPNAVLNDPADLARVFGSPEAAERAVQDAVGYGLDFTFASDTLTGSINKALIDTINKHPMLSAIQAFPRYAWSAAPRFVWDHSPGVLVDMATQVLTGGRVRLGQRFMRGQQTAVASDMLGRRETRLHEISLARGTLLQARMALTKQRAILRRRIDTLERYEAKGTITGAQRQSLEQLQREIRETTGALNGQMTGLGRLQAEERTIKAQVKALARGYSESAAAAAPESYGEILGKATVGLAFWSAAHAIRSGEDQQDLPWYKIRTGDNTVVDTRAFGPLTFYLFFGDLTADLGRNTDVAEYRQKFQEKVAAGGNRVAASVAALRESYHGKYTEGQGIREAAQLVFGLSPASGVTATFYDMLAPEGLTIDNLGESALTLVGEWLAGPLQPLSDVSNLFSLVDPGEAVIRDAGMIRPETPYAELAQPLTKIPGVKQLFPEQYSQTSGEVVRSQSPITRTLGGVTLSKPPNPVESILQEAGVPGSKVYLPRLDDVGLTQQLAKVHADSLRQMHDEWIRGNPDWEALKTPEERRTYLTMPGGPLSFARTLTWATMQDYGEERIAALRESPARKQAAERQLRLLERWSQGTAPPDDATPPPAIPAGRGLSSPPPAPGTTLFPPPPR